MAWNNRWAQATPLYQDAAAKLRKQNDLSAALYAEVSQDIVRAESEPIQPLLHELEMDLSTSAGHDPKTRLRILLITGMLSTNYDAAKARQVWREVEHAAWKRHEYRLMMRAIGEQGIAAFLMGDIGASKRLVTRAWIAAKYLHDPAAQVRYASVYGSGLVELGRYEEADQVLNRAIIMARSSPEVAYPSIAVNSEIDALRGLHRYGDALALATECLRNLPAGRLDAHLFQIQISKGEIYADLDRWEESAEEYQRGLQYAQQVSYWRGIIQIGGLLANADEHLDRWSDALASIDSAIDANAHLPQELYFLPQNLATKAEVLQAMHQRRQARHLYKESIDLSDRLLATAPTPEVTRLMISELRKSYTGYYRALLRQGNLDKAFQTIERARGRVEAEALEEHSEDNQATNLVEQKIAILNARLLQAVDPGQRHRLENKLYGLELQITMNSPESKTFHTPETLSSVQRSLRKGEVLLEYILDNNSSVVAITSEGAAVYNLPTRRMLSQQIREYRTIIMAKGQDMNLGRLLFDELLGRIPECRANRSFIIVPDEELHLLPFAALVERDHYLVETHDVSVVPSATVLYLLRKRDEMQSERRGTFLGVAPWTEDDENIFPPLDLAGASPAPLPALPATKSEVEMAAAESKLRPTLLLGPQATETRFKQLSLDQFDVIHLALHAYADAEYPDRSSLVFAPEEAGPDDGLLSAREIRHLHLDARLVVLSACDTGSGQISETDVANLANSFLEAGSHSVVSSLWGADDKPTAQLMETFYRFVSGGDSLSEALQKTQGRLQATGLVPFYWSGFELSGDGSEHI